MCLFFIRISVLHIHFPSRKYSFSSTPTHIDFPDFSSPSVPGASFILNYEKAAPTETRKSSGSNLPPCFANKPLLCTSQTWKTTSRFHTRFLFSSTFAAKVEPDTHDRLRFDRYFSHSSWATFLAPREYSRGDKNRSPLLPAHYAEHSPSSKPL